MKQCTICGHIHNAPNFCPNCGSPVLAQAPGESGTFQAPQSPPRVPAPAEGITAPETNTQKKKARLPLLLAVLAVAIVAVTVIVIVFSGDDGRKKGVIELQENAVYTDYDITGDGTADELRVEYRAYHETCIGVAEADIIVNGETVKTYSGAASIILYLLTPEKNNVFISPLFHFRGGAADLEICKYKNGTIEECTDENVFLLTQAGITGAAKGCISAEVNTFKYEAWLVSTETTLSFKAFYDVNSDKAVLRSNLLPACETYDLIANKSFTASSSRSENDSAGCFISEGDKVRITGCYIEDVAVSFEIECKGQTGWVSREISGSYADPLFRAE